MDEQWNRILYEIKNTTINMTDWKISSSDNYLASKYEVEAIWENLWASIRVSVLNVIREDVRNDG